MARQRRTWEELRGGILRRLRELLGANWENDSLLDFWNEEMEMLEMDLQSRDEGYGVAAYTADLVSGQDLYQLPDDASRLRHVIRVFTAQNIERVLTRDEKYSGSVPTSTSGGSLAVYHPTYRIVGNFIKLQPPPPINETGGLKIEMEAPTDLFENDDDKIPQDWPLYAETMLQIATVLAAYEHEDAQGLQTDEAPSRVRALEKRLARYQIRWDEFVEKKSEGRHFAQPYKLGG